MKRRIAFALFLGTCSVACDEMGQEVQTVEEMRVLGARVEDAREPSNAQPGSSGDVTLRWLVASNRAETFEAELVVCRASAVTMGVQECDGRPFHEETAMGDTETDLVFEFTLPALDPGTEWLAKLAVCASGRPGFSQDGVGRCSDGSAVLEALTTAWVGDEEPNRNPDLTDDLLSLNEETWMASAELEFGESCPAGVELPKVRAGVVETIRFELGGDDREELPRSNTDTYGASATESLVFAHFLTMPGLARPFSSIEAGKRDPAFDLELDLDAKSLGSGEVAGFMLVVRDDRGGADWLRRKLCATSR
jgi:hypothetical protein